MAGKVKERRQCYCGVEFEVPRQQPGKRYCSFSCSNRTKNITHGMSKTREYKTWSGMRGRCLNPNNPKYPIYGGRGIKICERWDDPALFIADMGKKPIGHSLDRIDPNGDYCPSNCRWAPDKVQQNNRRDNVMISFNGETKTVSQWSAERGLRRHTVRARLSAGCDIELVLTRGDVRHCR